MAANGNGAPSQSYRTWTLVFLDLLGAWALAYLTKVPELVYAFGIVAGAALCTWIGGKAAQGYTSVLQTRAQVAYPPAQVAGTTTQRTETEGRVITATQTAPAPVTPTPGG